MTVPSFWPTLTPSLPRTRPTCGRRLLPFLFPGCWAFTASCLALEAVPRRSHRCSTHQECRSSWSENMVLGGFTREPCFTRYPRPSTRSLAKSGSSLLGWRPSRDRRAERSAREDRCRYVHRCPRTTGGGERTVRSLEPAKTSTKSSVTSQQFPTGPVGLRQDRTELPGGPRGLRRMPLGVEFGSVPCGLGVGGDRMLEHAERK